MPNLGDTGKKGTPSAANAGMEVNSQVTSAAKNAKSSVVHTRRGKKDSSIYKRFK